MDLSAVSGTLPTHTTGGGPALEQELSLSSTRCQTESGGTILLQLLEFKTHLLEAVEELHIRRDAETRFEDQISKLVLEKQELEWEKESQQHQTETMAHQHAEALNNVKKQFEAKIRNIEEEKGKYQASAELKDKEINNLKEELKSLQLLKYNLEKKSSELEQKLALQSRSKDSHLNQLGEVEKRFSALSRQCAMVKQAHEKLEQNVDEAVKRNKKLTSANEKQEAVIVSLKKELEDVNNKLIKAKMLSSVRHEKSHSPPGREQRIQQLQQKLNMETAMNKKLEEENVAVRAEKQEVIRSLQHTQQLLLSQTQTVSRVELELQAQREQYQALKQEHEVMREKSKATEDKVAQLMENYAASKTSWDKEREMFLGHIKSEQKDLQAARDAYNELHQRHTELSSQANVQAQHIYELEKRDSSHSLSGSTQFLPAVVEEIRGEKTLNEPISSFEPPCSGSLQHLASTQTEKPDCLQDTGAVTKLVDTGTIGGQDIPGHHQQSQFKQPVNPSNPFTDLLPNNNVFSLCSLSETTGSDRSMLNKHNNNWNTSESDTDVVSALSHNTSSVSEDSLQISKGSCISSISTAPSASHRSVNGSVDLLSKEKSDDVGLSKREEGWKDDVNREEEEGKEEQQWNRAQVQGEDVKEGGSAGEKRGTLMAQTTDRADREEDSQRSTDDAGDTEQPETETEDRAELEGTGRAEERGKTGPHTPETQIQAQTATDTTTEKSDTQQVIDFMETESPLAACELSDCSQSVSQKGNEKVADSNKVHETRREVFCPVEHQSASHGSNSVMQHLCHDEAQTFAQDVLTMEEKPSDKSAANIPRCRTAALAAQVDSIVSMQELETAIAQTQARNPPDISINMKQMDEMCDTEREECVLVSAVVGQQAEQLRSPVTDNEDSQCSANKKSESQSNVDTQEDDTCETVQGPLEKSNLKDACVDVTKDTVVFESETGSSQEHMKNDKVEDAGDAKTTETDVHPSHEKESSAKQLLVEDPNESSPPSNKTYRSSLDWGSIQRKTVNSKSDVSVLHQFVQGSPMPEQNTSDPGGLLRHPSSTIPTFFKTKHNKVPLVITSALDLLNASSVSGTAASSRRHPQGEWKAIGETCRETATADKESRASLSISSFPVSTSSITVSSVSRQTTPGCSRAPASAAGPSSESDWKPSFSQEGEDQQSSVRAHISKIEQFLNTERLRLPKRRRTEN